jgi:single-stranded DNA-specific DHH superfamily exonuclease
MKMKNKALYNQFKQFFLGLKPSDNIALLHDTDPDGNSSGKIIDEAINQLGCKIKLYLVNERKDHSISDKSITLLKEHNINKLITTDKVVDESPEQIRKIEQFAEICIFDHHIIQHDVSSKRTVFLKPQLLFNTKKPEYYCSAKFSYDLLSSIVNLNDLDWICAAGIIGDSATKTWKIFLKKTLSKYHLPEEKNIYNTKIGLITKLIFFAEALNEPEECFNLLLQSKSIDEALTNLSKYHKVKTEVEKYQDKFESLTEKYQKANLYLLEIHTPSKIKSYLSNLISQKHPHKNIIILQQINNEMTISARRSDGKLNMDTLLKESLQNVQGNGGGHCPAAGGSVIMRDFPKFKEQLIKIAEQMEQKKTKKIQQS